MHVVREFEAVVIDHALGQRRAHQLPAGGGADERAELGMARAEITGVGERGRMTRRLEPPLRSEEHTSELQSLMRISYAVFCLKKKKQTKPLYLIIHPKT